MNALLRFLSLGAADADRRVAAALAPEPLHVVDRYLRASGIVIAIDGATRWLRDTWRSSVASQRVSSVTGALAQVPREVRYRGLGVFLLAASAVHVVMVWLQGPRPGWFWLVIPVLTSLFGLLVIAGSRGERPPA